MFPFSKILKAIGNPVRQDILLMLKENKEMPVKDMVEKTGLAQSTVSHHLGILKKAGVVKSREDGTQACYCICCDMIADCCLNLKDFFKDK